MECLFALSTDTYNLLTYPFLPIPIPTCISTCALCAIYQIGTFPTGFCEMSDISGGDCRYILFQS